MKVACVQVNSGADTEANIAKLGVLVQEAARQSARLVALPENAFLMEMPGAPRMLYAEAVHPAIHAACRMASVNRCWLLVGSVAVKIDESGKTANRSLLIDDQGRIVFRYDKIHLFDVELPNGEVYAESARFLPGDQAVVASMPEATIGLSICYDIRFPHLYRDLAKKGADIIAVPAAFTKTTGEAHWHVLLRSRAIENGCYVIAPAQTGTHPGNRATYGHALIVDPWGRVMADAGVEEGIITTELDLDVVKQTRGRLPSLAHDRDYRF